MLSLCRTCGEGEHVKVGQTGSCVSKSESVPTYVPVCALRPSRHQLTRGLLHVSRSSWHSPKSLCTCVRPGPAQQYKAQGSSTRAPAHTNIHVHGTGLVHACATYPTQTTVNRTVYNTFTGVCMVLGIHLHTSTPQFHQNHCLSHT